MAKSSLNGQIPDIAHILKDLNLYKIFAGGFQNLWAGRRYTIFKVEEFIRRPGGGGATIDSWGVWASAARGQCTLASHARLDRPCGPKILPFYMAKARPSRQRQALQTQPEIGELEAFASFWELSPQSGARRRDFLL